MRAIRTEVMRNRFAAIVEEASIVLYRTAHTTFIKQTQDYQSAMCTIKGEVFAYPRFNGVATLIGLNLAPAIEAIGVENMEPGDVIITNDPYATEGVCTHMPDVFVLRPIFYKGELQCFSWAFAHVSDIGGAVPSSISPTFTEIFQEGLRLRPVKLYKAGELNSELLAVLYDNSRIPDQTWGDIKAMCSALASMDRRIVELCDRFGTEHLQAGINDVLDYAEGKARELIEALPDGSWSFSDYLEVVPGEPMMLHCKMTIKGSEVMLDFAGSAPQVQAACNFVTGKAPHPAFVRPFVAYLLTTGNDMPMNGGLVRPMTASAPKGSVMNAEYPAACGNRAATYTRIYDLILACLNQAIPGGLAAGGASQAAIIAASVNDRNTRKPKVSVVEPMIGSSGGRRGLDGIDAIDTPNGFLRSAPIEAVENEMPFIVRRFGLVVDSFAAGEWRGGAALDIEIENREIEATFSVRGCDRFTFQPWGAAGGDAGKCGLGTKNGNKINMIELQKLGRGDRLYLRSPAGAGFGDPFVRDPKAVLTDVVDGLLTPETAEREYGVVIVQGAIDERATAKAREGHKKRSAFFDLGRRREEYEKLWSNEATIALSKGLLQAPSGVRDALKTWVRERQPEGATPEKIKDLISQGLEHFA